VIPGAEGEETAGSCVATLSVESDGPRCPPDSHRLFSRENPGPGAELALKPGVLSADVAGVSVDSRLLDYWQREQVARRKARAALPVQWRNDPRPEMHQVVDVYVELLAAERQRNVVPLALEDR
jgi:hypothetical protein